MKKLLFILPFLLFTGCSDGDFSIEALDFGNSEIRLCNNFTSQGEYVFYQLSEDNKKALIINIKNTTENITERTGTFEYTLSNDNTILYRIFDGDASGYFCNEVQPTSPKVVEEWIATSGTIEISTVLTEDDNDGVPAEEEGYNPTDPASSQDTDGDGLPDYKDIDDDGDNVPTSAEGYNAEDPAASRDTDNDGTPDYLDRDDDGDGIDTRLEDVNQNGNPADDIDSEYELPNYREPAISVEYPDVPNRDHTYRMIYASTIRIINSFQLQGNGEMKYDASGYNYGIYTHEETSPPFVFD